MERRRSLDELRQLLARPASMAVKVTHRPLEGPFGSFLGAVRCLRESESWPIHNGSPMRGVAQIDLREVPHVPGLLEGLAIITLFVGMEEEELLLPDRRPNGDGWLLRAYESTEGLIAAEPNSTRWSGIRWEQQEDLPDWDDAADAIGPAVLESLVGNEYERVFGSAKDGTKVGGWPRLIQGHVFWAPLNQHPAKPSYCLQVDSDERTELSFGGGVLHIGRGTEDRTVWVAETQMF